jgi:hypoxia up-regulated 1
MRAMDKLDRDRAAREEAHNTLEAYVYRARDFLSDDLFRRVASTQEHNSFKAKLEEISEWLFSSEHATLEEFRVKLSELTFAPLLTLVTKFRDIEGPISKRKTDLLARPASIENLRLNLNSSKSLLEVNREYLASKNRKKEKDKFDLEDEEDSELKLPPGAIQFLLDEKSIETLQGAVDEVESWLHETSAAQEELDDWEEPVLLLSEIERKSNHLQSVLRKIVMEKAKTANKPKSSSSTPTATATASASKKAEETVEEEGTTTGTATIIETGDAEETGSTDRKHEEL